MQKEFIKLFFQQSLRVSIKEIALLKSACCQLQNMIYIRHTVAKSSILSKLRVVLETMTHTSIHLGEISSFEHSERNVSSFLWLRFEVNSCLNIDELN